MGEIDLSHRCKHGHGNMRRAAVAGRSEIELARIRLGIGDEFTGRGCRDRGIDQQDQRCLGDQADRLEILDGIVRQALVERLVDGMGADQPHENRIAIGGRLGCLGSADIAASAGTIFDDHGLAQALR